MENVTIKGYSGDTSTLISEVEDGSGRWSETAGGAMRIQNADYTAASHTSSNPTLHNVNVTQCCRGIRIEDSTAAYVKDCIVYNISDNGVYLAASSYLSDTGCQNCVIENCKVTLIGNTGLMNIGGSNNKFIKCEVENTRGAGGAVYNTNDSITYDRCTFTSVNNEKTTTPHGNTDDFSGAAFGMSVKQGDGNANVTVISSTFVSGGDSVFFKNSDVGVLKSENNDVTITNFPGGWFDELSKDILIIPKAETAVYTVDGNMATMKVSIITRSLADVIDEYNWDPATQNLTILGCGVLPQLNFNGLESTWTNFQFDYSNPKHGTPGKLHFQDITLSTTSIDGYAVRSHNTLTTMNNVTITGYSGDTT